MRLMMRNRIQNLKAVLQVPASSYLLLVLWSWLAAANAVSDNSMSAELPSELVTVQLTVRELMHLDMSQALRKARESQRNIRLPQIEVQDKVAELSRPSEPLILTALYGLGASRFAQVEYGPSRLLFMQGRSAPVGMNAALAPYRLKDIKGRCVTLEDKAGESTLCLALPAWER